MNRAPIAVAVAAAFALALSAAPVVLAAAAEKAKRPKLEVRVLPRFGFSPLNALAIAELKGGDDHEDLYCPEIEWEWDDGGRSVTEPDCPAYEAGVTKIERRFSAEHLFKRAGNYQVKVTLRRNGDQVAQGSVRLEVKPGPGDPTIEE
ncbi:MAG: hypothetical protein KJ067_22575 [Vicinamibacteria bacterium]|jgi:hypothetical protein|nr:hypothetical protein [Vicinamibacteria bacterium]